MVKEYKHKAIKRKKVERETKKQMSAGVLLSYSVIIVQVLSGLLYTPIVLRSLGQSQYGIYSLCTSFMGYLTIMNAGVNAAYVRFYVQTKEKDEKRIPGLNGIFLKIFVVLAFIALIGGWIIGIFSPQIFGDKISTDEYELVRQCFRFLAINSSVQVLNCVFSSIIIANERFIFGKLVNLIVVVFNPVITTPFLLSGYNCVIIIIVHLVMSIAALILNATFCFRVFHTKFYLKEKDVTLLKDIAQFSGFIVLQAIMDQLNWQIDKFILARTRGTGDISLYSVGATFNTYYLTFSGALSGVFIAQINKLQALNESKKINDLFIKSSRIFAYLVWLIMSAYIIFGQQFVIRWAGKEYELSYFVGFLLMLPVTLALTMGLGQDIARAKNKHQLQIVINVSVCIVNALISIPLAIRWGAIGSAVGTFIAEIIICCIIQPIYYKRILGLDIKKFFAETSGILRGLVIPVIYGSVVCYFHLVKPTYGSIGIYGVIYVILYTVSMRVFAMNEQEKNFAGTVISKIIKKKQ